MYRNIRTIITFIPLSLLLFACAASQPVTHIGPDAEVIDGGLHRVANSALSKAYVDPAFNIDDFEKIFVEPLDVSSIALINVDLSRSDTAWQLNESDRQYLVDRYHTSMIKNFFGMGGYAAASGPGEGVLRVRVAITRVGPKLSDSTDSGNTTSKFRTNQFTRGGDVQISGIVDDSSTGKPLARFVDIRDSRSNWGLKNELTNREEAKEMFESWARLFVFRLQESRKRQQQSGKSW